MDRGRVIRLVLIPIVAGLIVTLVAQQLMQRQTTSAAPPEVETVPVVVVASMAPIPARTRLEAKHFTVRQVPKELTSGQEFSSVSDLEGMINVVELLPGEVLLRARVVAEGQGALPYRIPEGMRAVTIRMDELNGVAGHPRAGDLIDLVLYLPEKAETDWSPYRPASSRLLFESVLVLDKGLSGAAEDESRLTSLTVALTPQQATEVALAEQVGYIKMLLRPALEEEDAGSYRVDETRYR